MSLTESQITMLLKKDDTQIFANKNLNAFIVFWVYVFKKIIFSLVSVKLWCFVGVTWVCTYLTVGGFINGANFAAIMCTMITTVLAAREVAKMSFNTAATTVASSNPVADKALEVATTIKDKILNEMHEELDD